MAHNEHHQFPTCPSGHPITNLLLKSNSRFQVTFVTNSSSISIRSRTRLGHANQRWDNPLPKLARLCSFREPNPTYGSQFGLAVRSLTLGRGFTVAEPEWSTPLSIHMSLQPSVGTPPLFGLGVTPGQSREFWTFSLGTSWGCISLTRYPIGVLFRLLERSFL